LPVKDLQICLLLLVLMFAMPNFRRQPIRKAISLPSDVAFYRLDTFSERVILVSNLAATVDQSLVKGKGKLASQDDVVDNLHSLVVDSMEKTVSFNDIFFYV
jgi:hypothetical protein